MKTVSLGGVLSSKLGYGAMSLSPYDYTLPEGFTDEIGVSILKGALELGITHIDTALLYGSGHNEKLIGQALAGLSPQERGKLCICTKTGVYFGADGIKVTGDPEFVRKTCMESLERLGTPYIDIYYLLRIDTEVAIEETMKVLKDLVHQGYIKAIGLSDASAGTIRKAHAIHPISAVQLEWSLWARDVEADIIPTCRELGIGIVAYSPLGRGFLTGSIKKPDDLPAEDIRTALFPRFQGDAFDQNRKLVEKVEVLAAKKGCSTANLALAWVLAQGDDVVPIPRTAKVRIILQG